MSEPQTSYRAWQEGTPNDTPAGGPWFVTVPDGGDIEIGYDASGKPDEYHARLFAAADALVKALEGLLPWLEDAETKCLVGDEGCIWAVEHVRAALASVGSPPEGRS